MPKKLSKSKQSIFDIVSENFGTLDNLIKLSDDNSISISGNLLSNTELTVNNTGLGEADIKQEINDTKLTFNNNYQTNFEGWILATGFWNDFGVWIDTETWID